MTVSTKPPPLQEQGESMPAPVSGGGLYMTHRWGELITAHGLSTLGGIMARFEVGRDRIKNLMRDAKAAGGSSFDPLDSVEVWLANQIHDPAIRRRILAGTVQVLQRLRENAPSVPARPLDHMPGKPIPGGQQKNMIEVSSPPRWETHKTRPVLLWKDKEGVQWAALPNPLSLDAMRWLRNETGESNIWLRCLGLALEKEHMGARKEASAPGATEKKRSPIASGKDRLESWLMEGKTMGGVSDIHMTVTLTEKGPVGQVTYRHMGECVKSLPDIPLEHFLAVQRCLLGMADKTEGETLYTTYDKQINISLPNGEEFAGRLSMIPYHWPPDNTVWYSTVIRILSGKKEVLSLKQVAGELDYERVRALMNVDAGLVVVSGPTGSGKTTLLAALLSATYIERPGQRMLTVEDPVEIPIPGATQFTVEERRNLDFSTILRGFLRQDPDILLAGEVRDEEVASIVRRLAVSGHPVYTTVHANYSSTVAMRLQAMNFPPDYLAATLRWSSSQRLLKGCCPKCSPKSEIPTDPFHNHAELFKNIRKFMRRERLPKIVMSNPDPDPDCSLCRGNYAPRRLVIETLYWPGLPPAAFNRPEIEWWDDALGLGKMIPMWYRAVGRLLRQEVSLPSFVEKFSAPEPPFVAHTSRANENRLREHVVKEAGISEEDFPEDKISIEKDATDPSVDVDNVCDLEDSMKTRKTA